MSFTAIILAGGKGERLRPLTENVPKPLVEVNGKPILGYIIDHLITSGVSKIIVTVGYLAEKVITFVSRYEKIVKIEIVNDGDVDISNRIYNTNQVIDSDEFIVVYGDTISNVDVAAIIEQKKRSPNSFVMSVIPYQSAFGLVELAGEKVKTFSEKPKLDFFINIGYFVFDRHVFDLLTKYSTFADFLINLGNSGHFVAHEHKGYHVTVNTLNELEEAQRTLANIRS